MSLGRKLSIRCGEAAVAAVGSTAERATRAERKDEVSSWKRKPLVGATAFRPLLRALRRSEIAGYLGAVRGIIGPSLNLERRLAFMARDLRG
jgi:hypothetical protein